MEAVELWSGGVYRPFSRKDFTLDMRSNAEAEGERSIMGSGRLCGFWLRARAGLLAILLADGLGFRDMNGSASLRMCEKSWIRIVSCSKSLTLPEKEATHGGFDSSQDCVSIAHATFAIVDLQ